MRWLFAFLFGAAATGGGAMDWTRSVWQGEPVYISTCAGWSAVVSLTRARLMHFGPWDADVNLLLAPPTRANRNRLGGHRLWLGPQTEWPGFWPPPAAWEYQETEAVEVEDGVLRLTMGDAGAGWPRLVRTYHWDAGSLVCGAESSGGTRPAQFIHILQVPAETTVRATVHPAEGYPAGYVRLLSTAGPFTARFVPPPHAALAGDELTLRHTGTVGKYGFRPQPLTGAAGGYELVVARGAQAGKVMDDPDEGFHSQVYLSEGGDSFVEIEQLSPRFTAGTPARFEMILTGRAPAGDLSSAEGAGAAADLLARITQAAQTKDAQALAMVCVEARHWLVGERLPPDVATMSRRERMYFALRVVVAVDSLIVRNYQPEIAYLNVRVPGTQQVTDPEVRKRYEQAVAENTRKIKQNNIQSISRQLKEEWLGHVSYLATELYAKGATDRAELRQAVDALAPAAPLWTELVAAIELPR